MKRVGLLGPARFLFPEWYNLPLLLLQSFAKKYTINCKIIGKAVERRRSKATKGLHRSGWQPAARDGKALRMAGLFLYAHMR